MDYAQTVEQKIEIAFLEESTKTRFWEVILNSRITPYPSIWKLRQIEQPLRDPRLQIWIPTRLCPSPKKLFAADTLNPHF
jgi:hypothetical protein